MATTEWIIEHDDFDGEPRLNIWFGSKESGSGDPRAPDARLTESDASKVAEELHAAALSSLFIDDPQEVL